MSCKVKMGYNCNRTLSAAMATKRMLEAILLCAFRVYLIPSTTGEPALHLLIHSTDIFLEGHWDSGTRTQMLISPQRLFFQGEKTMTQAT